MIDGTAGKQVDHFRALRADCLGRRLTKMHHFGEKEVQYVEVIAIRETMIYRSTTQMTMHV
jgi:hypothetical protein